MNIPMFWAAACIIAPIRVNAQDRNIALLRPNQSATQPEKKHAQAPPTNELAVFRDLVVVLSVK